MSTIVASAQKPSVTLEDVAKNSQAAEDASEIQKTAPAQPATQEITEYKPMDTTGRDVVEVDFEDIGIVTGTITEGAAAKFKIISDKDNPNKGTLEILPSVETLDIFSQLNKLVNFHPKKCKCLQVGSFCF